MIQITPPKLDDNLSKNTLPETTKNKKTLKASRSWSDIVKSSEYKEAETSGKLLNIISYEDEENADEDSNYLLIKMTSSLDKTVLQTKEMTLKINHYTIWEISYSDTNNLPFYCFPNDTDITSEEDLNFNNLNTLKECEQAKFILLNLNKTNFEVEENLQKNINNWHETKPQINFEFLNCSSQMLYFSGEILKILHKEYQPTTAK